MHFRNEDIKIFLRNPANLVNKQSLTYFCNYFEYINLTDLDSLFDIVIDIRTCSKSFLNLFA